MVVELASVAGGTAGMGVVVGGILRRIGRGNGSPTGKTTKLPQAEATWRVLETDEDLRQPLERAIACEQASIVLSEKRAERFDAMRVDRQPASTRPVPARKRGEQQRATGPRVPRAS